MGSRVTVFRRKVALGEYELTGHAKDEMEQDGFTIVDVKSAIYNGRAVATQRRPASTKRYVLQGRALDGRRMRLVCRLTSSGLLRIITVFAVRG